MHVDENALDIILCCYSIVLMMGVDFGIDIVNIVGACECYKHTECENMKPVPQLTMLQSLC